ncbi:MAG: hypothetical protein QOG87_1658 [Actinomycetota bacterium]|jgi:hypothetical protein
MASLVGFGLLVPVLLLGVLVLAVASVAGGRSEPDPDGERPFALYLAAMAFVAVFLSLGAFSTIVSSAVDAGLGDDGPSIERIGSGFGDVEREALESEGLQVPDPILPDTLGDERDNERIRTMVIAGLLLAAAGGLFVWHDQRLNDFRNSGRSPGWRTAQVSGYVICFLALLVALGAVVTFGYAIFQMIAPGVAGVAERDDGLQPTIVSAVTAIAAAGIFIYHWGRLDRRGTGGARLADVVAPLPPPPAPTQVHRQRPLRGTDPPASTN